MSVRTSRTAPLIAPPAFAKSSAPPYPTSTTFASIPPAGVAGDQPSAFSRTGNFTAPSNSSRVSPSLHVTGSVYFSVWTSTPAARNAPTPHSTALAISGDPVTRPPISSVIRRRLSSSGDEPITTRQILVVRAGGGEDFACRDGLVGAGGEPAAADG